MKKLTLLALIIFSTTGCYSLLGIEQDSKIIYNQNMETYDINNPHEQLSGVDVYFGVNTKPKIDYIQLAYLEASGNEGISMEALVKALKEEAIKKGADAIMEINRTTVNHISSSISVINKESGYKTYSNNVIVLTGIAIKYIEKPADSSNSSGN